MAQVLIIRLSAFGDVALLAPAVYSVASRYPQVRFDVMTRSAFAPLFNGLGFNVNVVSLDVRGKHSGFLGLFRIIGKAFSGRYTHVADTHDVLRSKIIRTSLRLTFTKVVKINKGRKEKSSMIRNKNTDVPLKHTIDRYMDVFSKLGFPCEMSFENLFDFKSRIFSILNIIGQEKVSKWIGIAPFAQHRGKIYPLDKMQKVIAKLSEHEDVSLFIFGAGKSEMRTINQWESIYPKIISHHHIMNLEAELSLISYLDVMISMDSANSHLASLVNVPVVSIWGATHPALGFYGFNQKPAYAIQADLNCRPCSVYGNDPCQFAGANEYKCLTQIDEHSIVSKVESILYPPK